MKQPQIKVGMKVKLLPVSIGDFWKPYIGKTFKVIYISPAYIYLKTPEGCKQENGDVPTSIFWIYFALADQQLEFDFGK